MDSYVDRPNLVPRDSEFEGLGSYSFYLKSRSSVKFGPANFADHKCDASTSHSAKAEARADDDVIQKRCCVAVPSMAPLKFVILIKPTS